MATGTTNCFKTCPIEELYRGLRGSPFAKRDLTDYSEICRNLLLGNESIAQDVAKLKSLGVTHVLNAAHGAIDVSKEYEKVGIEYLGVPADDVPTYNLKQHFEPAAAFINTAVKKGKVLVHCHVGYSRSPTLVAAYLMLYQELTAQESITLIRGKRGKVLVHCQIGYSRSPTLVAAYLMLYHELTAQEAIRLIRGKRFIGPNDGFLRQLCEFNDQLVEEGRLELP